MHSDSADTQLFKAIVDDIRQSGVSVQINALDEKLCRLLSDEVRKISDDRFKQAGIGRKQSLAVNHDIRSDNIFWIDDTTKAGIAWLSWAESLQNTINSQLFLGLFSFESHFARYRSGDFYKKHQDAFVGQANRVLSLLVYLNRDWSPEGGGELVIYTKGVDDAALTVKPTFGTIVLFLSEEFPHEVLPAKRDRYSIAGWYRLNSSNTDQIDPPT